MTDRPAVGARVRFHDNTGMDDLVGRIGTVTAHHEDGVGFRVRLGGPPHDVVVCDPLNVELVRAFNGRTPHVGWLYLFQDYYCLAHKPAAPLDEWVTKVYRSDVTEECCENCGTPLLASVVEATR